MDPYWKREIARNAARERWLLTNDPSGFYRAWKRDGSPNSRFERRDDEDDEEAPCR